MMHTAEVGDHRIEIVIEGGWVDRNLALHQSLGAEVEGDIWPAACIERRSKCLGEFSALEFVLFEISELECVDIVVQFSVSLLPN